MRILLAEDDKRLSKMLEFLLKKENYIVDCVYDGQEALDYANLSDYDIMILDWMMPIKDGIEVCRTLRQTNKQIAILMLTARDTLDDRIEGLDSGADDYLAKPFEFPELLARLRALSRRIDKTFYSDIIKYKDLELNCSSANLRYKDKKTILSPRECQIMELFVRNIDCVLPREQIMDKIWGYDTEVSSNTLDVTIKAIRQKLSKIEANDCIHTIRGIGYKFKMD
ncbi:DNA-binding response regulator [Megamonas hypermegale]|uniref:response regulator transcription factor n=1 Tax=Megamonas hypermegale TaxID=158847 RepID=UPI000B375AFD|nr:response regulator transcription factor [Megamonas hypermegale]OUO39251.1 DNA-binding response regulator [Megamonas hypermegale]